MRLVNAGPWHALRQVRGWVARPHSELLTPLTAAFDPVQAPGRLQRRPDTIGSDRDGRTQTKRSPMKPDRFIGPMDPTLWLDNRQADCQEGPLTVRYRARVVL